MRFSASLGAVTARGFARDNGRPDSAFSDIVGGIQFIDIQETQQVEALLAQSPDETLVVRVGHREA